MRRGLSRHNNRSGGNYFNPLSLFAGGVQGVWYDDSLTSSMYQDSAGTIPAALESPVGKQLDLSGNNNHRTQATSANRPTLSARYNLLTKTEDFSDAAWIVTACTKSGTTVGTVVALGPTSTRRNITELFTIPSAGTWKVSFLLTNISQRYVQIYFGGVVAVAFACTFDLTGAGAVSNIGGAIGAISLNLNGTYSCSMVFTTVAGEATNVVIAFVDTSNAVRAASSTSTGSFSISKPDFRASNQSTGLIPTYQYVDTSSVYDTAGFPQYIKYNGSNTYLVTAAVNFSSTAQIVVFSGIRKLANYGGIVDASYSGNLNTFLLLASGIATELNSYSFLSKGTVLALAEPPVAIYTPPITNVLTGLGNISAPSVTLRINGAQVSSSTATQGTGNFSNLPLYFGSRQLVAPFLNGQEFQTIIVGKLLTTAEITATETYVNSKTKAY